MKTQDLNLVLIILLLLGPPSYSQIKVVPVPRDNNTSKNENVQAETRTKAEVLSLPFWDDFSTSSTQPDTSSWLDSPHVRINNGLGNNMPTLKIASFDGLDGSGNPYSLDPAAIGETDSLLSKPIDLSLIPLNKRSSVILSFFYQKAGSGEIPDEEDFIKLEFKTANSGWIQAWPASLNDLFPNTDVFTRVMIPIEDSLFHNNFQFKFTSIGRQSGPFDTWNIDFVYLDDGRESNSFDFLDRAITSLPSSIFKNYTAVPMRQFLKDDNILDSTFIKIFNYETSQPVQGIEYTTIIKDQFSNSVLDTLVNKRALIINSEELLTLWAPPLNFENLQNDIRGPDDSLSIQLEFFVDTGDTLLIDEIDPDTKDTTFHESVDLRVNDTTRRSFIIHDFLAYDDGTAEFGAGVNQNGGSIAYKFQMSEPDTLIDIRINFPNIGKKVSGIPIEIFVLDDLNDNDSSLLFSGNFTIQSSGINEFKSYKIEPAVIVSDTFFIGFRQTTEDFVPVGLDKNTDSGDKMFFNVSGAWEQNETVEGSLLIRPRFGTGALVTGLKEEIMEEKFVKIYPNPSSGSFKISGKFNSVRAFNILGKEVKLNFGGGNSQIVKFVSVPDGMYILEIRKDNLIQIEKIILKR